jgi:hypothetical protein
VSRYTQSANPIAPKPRGPPRVGLTNFTPTGSPKHVGYTSSVPLQSLRKGHSHQFLILWVWRDNGGELAGTQQDIVLLHDWQRSAEGRAGRQQQAHNSQTYPRHAAPVADSSGCRAWVKHPRCKVVTLMVPIGTSSDVSSDLAQ